MSKKSTPKTCTSGDLRPFGIEMIGYLEVTLRCKKCQATWDVQYSKGRLIRDYHLCPQGCNAE